MKTIGVLGGLGPQATIDFELRLHRVVQQLIPQHANTGYPPLISWFFREPPVVIAPGDPPPTALPPAHPRLLAAARALGHYADFLVIPSNGVHLWQAEIAQAAGKPIVSMIDAVIQEVRRRGSQQVGLVDFRPAIWGVYQRPLAQLGVAWRELPEAWRATLDGVRLAVTEGRNGAAEDQQVQQAIALLRAQGVGAIILACTEFPLALTAPSDADVINPIELLVEAAVRAALAE
jgi:aspartate racemase